MAKPELALIVHAREEFGIDPDDMPSAISAATISFLCFVVGALLPVVPWFIGSGTAAAVASIVIGGIAASFVGGAIGVSAERPVARSAIRQVLIMLVACGATYLIGTMLNTSVSA